jgi:hypothetical protein
VKRGDIVRLIGIPDDVHDDENLQTRTLFEKCLGKTFQIEDLKRVEGLPTILVQLDVGHVLGKKSCMDSIWVEPQYLEPAGSE